MPRLGWSPVGGFTKAGRRLLAEQRQLRTRLTEKPLGLPTAEDRATAAVAEARNRGIASDQDSYL
jgi:hypothetical protein